jgi:hypothetical protein
MFIQSKEYEIHHKTGKIAWIKIMLTVFFTIGLLVTLIPLPVGRRCGQKDCMSDQNPHLNGETNFGPRSCETNYGINGEFSMPYQCSSDLGHIPAGLRKQRASHLFREM